jgi:hypothetical protein
MRNSISKLIRETVRQAIHSLLLTEGISDILYHFTSLNNGYNICKDDVIYLQSAFAKDSDNYDKKRKFYLSCTRMRGTQFGYSRKFSGRGVRIKLDGQKLSQNLKGKPINYWNGMNDKYSYYKDLPEDEEELKDNISWEIERYEKNNPNASEQDIERFIKYNFNRSAQEHADNESEDRLFSYEPSITNAHEYILSIDVLLPNIKEDEEEKQIAWAFMRTPLSQLVNIFDSVEEFNSLKGQKVDMSSIEYSYGYCSNESNTKEASNALNAVIQFIAYANPKFEGKNFGQETAKLLQKYGLTNFSNQIGNFYYNSKRIFSLDQVLENLNHLRRNLSDRPNLNNSRILEMMTDYFRQIGADNFIQAFKIKKKISEKYYNNTKIYDEIDTNAKKDFLIINHVIILDASKTLFHDILTYTLNYNENDIKSLADSIAYDITENYEGKYTYSSKNYNSMFQFIYKLFRKGSVDQTLHMLYKIGIDNNYLDGYGLTIQNKNLDYWESSRYDTINTVKTKALSQDYDYYKLSKQNDEEIGQYFPNKSIP